MTPHKRARLSSTTNITTTTTTTDPNSASSSFRNVSACNRCRVRKNRCDQNLPACSPCEKVGVKCTGFDPITKREIPRAYVYYLESRVSYLEGLLARHKINFGAPQEFDLGAKPIEDPSSNQHYSSADRESRDGRTPASRLGMEHKHQDSEKLDKLVSNIGMVSVQGTSDPRFLGSTSGISFARVVFAAVKSAVPNNASGKKSSGRSKPGTNTLPTDAPSMRDSFFGLQTKPTITPAPFPDETIGRRLLELYFEHANPQIPILHRGDFMALFSRVYATKERSARELYMLNIVFAIGAGIIYKDKRRIDSTGLAVQKPDIPTGQMQPEEYHSAAMQHLESFLGSMPALDNSDSGGGLEELQAVLLLAGFALLRPVAPGLWYITGVAVRLAVDLGLHYEDGFEIEANDIVSVDASSTGARAGNRGRRQWMQDLRRRLWWCVYSFDRLVSVCVGRPFGITDQVITTNFPSVLDDVFISRSGFSVRPETFTGPSYKRVSHHYFRLRLLQSEILQVLQYRQAQKAHENKRERANEFMHTKLSSSFLQNFASFRAWREDIDRRLWEWKESAPLAEDTNVQFSVKFLELNYWQAVIMLYRQSLSVPPSLADDVNEVASPMSVSTDEPEDEEDIYLKAAEAGQRVLKLYRQLHRLHLVNYTYLATVHLFMAGIAFLYAIWHSPTVRSRLSLDDVEYTVQAAMSVLADLTEKCPPAEACKDAFERMSKATIRMSLSTTGFKQPLDEQIARSTQQNYKSPPSPQSIKSEPQQETLTRPVRPPPHFDMNLRDLFPELQDGRSFDGSFGHWRSPTHHVLPMQPTSQQLQAPDPSSMPRQYDMGVQPTMSTSATKLANDPYSLSDDLDFLVANDDTVMYSGNPGLDLGFTGDVTWADGAQVDLFDGFFFGGTAGSG